MATMTAVETRLFGPRCDPCEIFRVDLPGLYALFVRSPDALPVINFDVAGLLYIGQAGGRANSKGTLHKRNYFLANDSSGSSLRRSLGALLQRQLSLRPYPRGKGLQGRDFTHFRFLDGGEERLTGWMSEHLTYTCAITAKQNICGFEKALIRKWMPPLNLEKCNGQAPLIQARRAECANDASA